MHASEVTSQVVERANELYWNSDRSVNQIAEELDLSKGALYGVLQPEEAGLGCPLCGDEVGWPNRTAKDRGSLACPTCEWDGAPEEAGAISGAAERRGSEGRDDGEDDLEGGDVPATLPPVRVSQTRLTTVAGGALIGAAVGLALVLWARRR